VYFHKATRGAEKIYTELLARTVALVRDGSVDRTGLPPSHPLVKFSRTPDDVDCALALDDSVIWGALSLMADAEDGCLASLARRLRDRKLYKCVDVRIRIAHAKGDAAAMTQEADRVCADVRTELTDWAKSTEESSARVLIDEQSRSPYKRITETKGPLDQINIRTDGAFLIDLAQRSKVVAELQTYRLFRVYHDDNDEQAKARINQIIDARISAWQP
jgi:HD superfamily phosphohydrolase